MTKAQIIAILAEDRQVTKAEARDWLDAFEKIVVNSVKRGDAVTITGFCKFSRKDIKARKAGTMISPFTKEEIKVAAKPASKGVRITALKGFKDAVASKRGAK